MLEQHIPPPPQETVKHSGMGIASFVISLVVGLGMFAIFAFAGFAEAAKPGSMNEQSPLAIAIGLMVIAGLAIALVGFCLGVAGLFQQNSRKIFAILGAVFNACILLGTIALIVLGLTMQQ